MVGAKSLLLDLDSSHQEGVRFIELALSAQLFLGSAIEGIKQSNAHLFALPRREKMCKVHRRQQHSQNRRRESTSLYTHNIPERRGKKVV